MIMRRRLLGLRLEQFWFDPEGYLASRAHVAGLRTLDPCDAYALKVPEPTLWIDLRAGEEAIFEGIHKRVRGYIRSGADRWRISRAVTPVERAEFYAAYGRFARERSLQAPDPSEEEALRIYLARDAEGNLVHGCAFLAFPAAGLFRYRYGVRVRESHAHPSIFWQAMRDARAEGFSHFDLGGVSGGETGDPHMSGIDRFKSQFGGRPAQGWLYLRSRNPLIHLALKGLAPVVRREKRLRRLLAALAPRIGHRRTAGPEGDP
jgi:hypothetical protein